jgi:hypothetical protein
MLHLPIPSTSYIAFSITNYEAPAFQENKEQSVWPTPLLKTCLVQVETPFRKIYSPSLTQQLLVHTLSSGFLILSPAFNLFLAFHQDERSQLIFNIQVKDSPHYLSCISMFAELAVYPLQLKYLTGGSHLFASQKGVLTIFATSPTDRAQRINLHRP